jgi:hypothetical protein
MACVYSGHVDLHSEFRSAYASSQVFLQPLLPPLHSKLNLYPRKNLELGGGVRLQDPGVWISELVSVFFNAAPSLISLQKVGYRLL